MGRAMFFLVVLLALAVRQAGATLDLSDWKPKCKTTPDYSVLLPKNPKFTNFTVTVTAPKGTECKNTPNAGLGTADLTISRACFSMFPTMELSLIFQEKNAKGFSGGLDYTEALISCTVNGNGSLQNVNATLTVKANPTVIPVTPEFEGISLNLALVTTDAKSDTTLTAVSLGQENVFLRVKHAASGKDHFLLAPMSCSGIDDPSHPTSTYTFFSASENKCRYDNEIMGPFTVTAPVTTSGAGDDISYTKFYPFKFTSGNKVTLTCEILVCPKDTTPNPNGNRCEKVLSKLTGPPVCQEQSPFSQPTSTTQATPSTTPSAKAPPTTLAATTSTSAPTQTARRRRRAAGSQKTHTRMLEVTYSVLDPDPVLQGPTAGGAGAAISVPLLAAVASLWIL